LQEQSAVHVTGGWQSWVEINPATAAEHDIDEGDWVWLVSPKGKIKVKAKIYPGAMPAVLNMPFGQGHQSYGRWAEARGENPNDIIQSSFDPMRKLPVWGATRVRLVRP
jgi:molybdopterin-containing oxidoreductase family iron-sulfur binding subunit